MYRGRAVIFAQPRQKEQDREKEREREREKEISVSSQKRFLSNLLFEYRHTHTCVSRVCLANCRFSKRVWCVYTHAHARARVLYTIYTYIFYSIRAGRRERERDLSAARIRIESDRSSPRYESGLPIIYESRHLSRRKPPGTEIPAVFAIAGLLDAPPRLFRVRSSGLSADSASDWPNIPFNRNVIMHRIAGWRAKFQIAQLYNICDIRDVKDDRSKYASRYR